MKPLLEVKVELNSFKNNEIKGGFPDLLLLYESHLEVKWRVRLTRIEKNEDGEDETLDLHFRGEKMLLRSRIIGVCAAYNTASECFECQILAPGLDANYTFLCKSFDQARKLKSTIQQWLLGEEPKYEEEKNLR